MICKNCGTQLSEGTVFCPHCGAQQTAPVKKDSSKVLVISLICVCSALVLILAVMTVMLIQARKEIASYSITDAYSLTEEYSLTDTDESYTEDISETQTQAPAETQTAAATTEKQTSQADLPIIKKITANDWYMGYDLNTGYVEMLTFDELGGFAFEAIDEGDTEAMESGEYEILSENSIRFRIKAYNETATLTLIKGSDLLKIEYSHGFGNLAFNAGRFNAYNKNGSSSKVGKNLAGKWKSSSDSGIQEIAFSGNWDNMQATVRLKNGKVLKNQIFQPMSDTSGKLYLDGYDKSYYFDLRKDQLVVMSVDEMNNGKINMKYAVMKKA